MPLSMLEVSSTSWRIDGVVIIETRGQFLRQLKRTARTIGGKLLWVVNSIK